MRNTEVSEFIDSAYIWQERATEAEAEAADWRKVAKQHMEKVCKLEAENAKLRAVVEAAKEWINCPCKDIRECLECTAFKFSSALAELDEEGEK